MNELMNHEKYETADFALIIYLSLSFPILSLNKSDLRRIYFVFEKTPELLSTIEGFFAGNALVEPGKYHSQMRLIKFKMAENA